jgi:ParB/RepB/Spo0J family partition protein
MPDVTATVPPVKAPPPTQTQVAGAAVAKLAKAAPLISSDKGDFVYHPLEILVPSPTNPRKHFAEDALAELAKTIADHGVLEPILVRPLATGDARALGKPVKLEIVAGERRWRASKIAGRKEIPCIVRPLTDKQTLEIQTIENAQREDLHPLEQAEGYERLIKDFGYTVEEIADKIGKSRPHVFQIRKLRHLAPKLREAFINDEMDTTLATVFARVPGASLQEEAWQKIKREFPNGFSFRAAAEFVRKNYMLDLARAPFPIADATLNPKAGACGACPKRTGNQADLFPDVKNGNVCTDPQCFQFKRSAHQQRTVEKLEEKGTVVITGAKAKAAIPYDYSDLRYPSAGLVDPQGKCWEDEKHRSYGQLAKLAGVSLAQIQVPQTGELRPVVQLEPLKKALVAKGIKLAGRGQDDGGARYRAQQKASEEKSRLETEARRLTWLAVRAKISKLDGKDLGLIAAAYWREVWHENHKRVLEAWQWPTDLSDKAVEERIVRLAPAQLARFFVDLALVREIPVKPYNSEPPAKLIALGRRHGVSLDKIRAGVQKAAKLKKAAKLAAKKQKARKASGTVKIVKPAKKAAAKKGKA